MQGEQPKGEDAAEPDAVAGAVESTKPAVTDGDPEKHLEEAAATQIQAMVRGNQARKDTITIRKDKEAIAALPSGPEAEAAAIKIQAVARGRSTRATMAAQKSPSGGAADMPSGPEAEEAATKIQAIVRGKQTRNSLATKEPANGESQPELPSGPEADAAATKIQAVHRGNQSRRETKKLSEAKGPTEEKTAESGDAEVPGMTEDQAATKIQAIIRGNQTRDAQRKEPNRLKGMLHEARQEAEDLRAHNIVLIKKSITALASHPLTQTLGVDVPKTFKGLDSVPQQYSEKLVEIECAHDLYAKRQEETNTRIRRLNGKVVDEDEKAQELRDAYKDFKRDIARHAVNPRTNRPIPAKWILQKEQEEEEIDQEVETRRLKNIHFEMQLKKLQDQMKEREQLAEGLHLMDFEQLKIENQTLNEKIEERNAEIHKLKKKTDATVQVLTHVREKLQFVTKENSDLQSEVTGLDKCATGMRDDLTKLKQKRERARHTNSRAKQQQGFVGNDKLVTDFESRKERIEQMEAKIASFHEPYAKMTALLERGRAAERRLMAVTGDASRPGTVAVETPQF